VLDLLDGLLLCRVENEEFESADKLYVIIKVIEIVSCSVVTVSVVKLSGDAFEGSWVSSVDSVVRGWNKSWDSWRLFSRCCRMSCASETEQRKYCMSV